MAQIEVLYKDPDFAVLFEGKWVDYLKLPKEEKKRLRDLGIKEYLTIKVDTVTGDTRVKP